jgi:hypothetical protein
MSIHSSDHVFDPGDMTALAHMTNIDRRNNTRTVPLRVLCLGLSRTGTVSLRQALICLGYSDCYHFASTLQENPLDTSLWLEALNAKFKGIGKKYGRPEWDALLGTCQAVTDTPCVIFYKELLLGYPDAKVILTERDDADQWFRSSMATVVPYASRMIPQTWFEKFKALFSPVGSKAVALTKTILEDTPVFAALWHDYQHGTETAKQVYADYNAEIRRLVPEENLLVFNVKEGWGPLCDFLSEEVPDEVFPRRNDKFAFAKNNDRFGEFVDASSQRNMLFAGAGLAAAVAMLVFAARWR